MDSSIPFIILLAVLLIDAAAGYLPGFRYVFALPLKLIRGITSWFDERLNRENRGRNARRFRGAFVLLVIALPVWGGALALSNYASQSPYGVLIDTCVLLFFIGGIVERLAEGLFGLVFWYLLLGLPAVILYRVVGAITDVIGRNSSQHLDFGFVARRLDDILCLPAALIAGPVYSVAAIFVPRANPFKAFAGWLRDLGARSIRGDLRGEGAIAGAFGIALGGSQEFGEETVSRNWVGEGRARVMRADAHRTSWLLGLSVLLMMTMFAAVITYLKPAG